MVWIFFFLYSWVVGISWVFYHKNKNTKIVLGRYLYFLCSQMAKIYSTISETIKEILIISLVWFLFMACEISSCWRCRHKSYINIMSFWMYLESFIYPSITAIIWTVKSILNIKMLYVMPINRWYLCLEFPCGLWYYSVIILFFFFFQICVNTKRFLFHFGQAVRAQAKADRQQFSNSL